jgi:hypothetical protein
MGSCCSSEKKVAELVVKPTKLMQTSICQNPIRYTFCTRKLIYITNYSNCHASLIVSSGPVLNISSVAIDKIGSITLDKTGTDKVQHLKLLANAKKSIRIHTSYIFITAFLFINGKWLSFWKNKEILHLDDIFINDNHIQEASLGN